MIQKYEYKVIPAPVKGRKGPGVKGPQSRFAHGLETVINELAVEGWEYLRADILPSEERQGLASSQTVYRSMLVFRRSIDLESIETPPLPLDDTTEEVLETRDIAENDEAPQEEPADDAATDDDDDAYPPNPTRD